MRSSTHCSGDAGSGRTTNRFGVERVYQQIKWRIVYGTYVPGKALSESVLAQGATAAAARRCVKRCRVWSKRATSERVPRKGWMVSPITLMSIQNTFDVRRLLEGTAAETAATRADAEAVARLRGLAEYPIFETTQESYRTRLTANAQFHLAVAAATQNGFMVDLVRHCLTQHNRVLSLGLDFPVHPVVGERAPRRRQRHRAARSRCRQSRDGTPPRWRASTGDRLPDARTDPRHRSVMNVVTNGASRASLAAEIYGNARRRGQRAARIPYTA